MEKKGNIQNFVIVMLSIAVVVMSVGFALSDIQLNLTGTANVKSASWNVQFQADSFKPNTGSATATTFNVGTDEVTFSVDLAEVEDVFDYNIIVENLGNFDAYLKKIELSDISEHSKYLSFTVTHNGQTYSETSNEITGSSIKTLTAKSGTESINIKAKYEKPADADDLPSTNKTVTLTVKLTYAEVLNTAS